MSERSTMRLEDWGFETHFSLTSLPLGREEEGPDIEFSHVINNLVSYAYVIKHQLKLWTLKLGGNFLVGERIDLPG